MKNILFQAVLCVSVVVALCACDSSSSRQLADSRMPLPFVLQSEPQSGVLYPIRISGSGDGYIDREGNVVVEPVLDLAFDFRGGYGMADVDMDRIVIDADGTPRRQMSERLKQWNETPDYSTDEPSDRRICLIDGRGKIVFVFLEGSAFFENAKKKERYSHDFVGFRDGIVMMERRRDVGIFSYSCRQTYGFVDMKGNWIAEPIYPFAWSFSEGLAAVCVSGTNRGRGGRTTLGPFGFIDTTGKLVIPAVYEVAYSFTEGKAAVRWRNGKWGYIDRDGNTVVPPQFDWAGQFSGGAALAAIKKNGRLVHGIIDSEGNWLVNPDDRPRGIDPLLDWGYWSVSEGRVTMYTCDKVGKNHRYGLMDLHGNIIVEPCFFMPPEFSDGLAAISLATNIGKSAYISTDGRFVTEAIFDSAWSFSDGMGRVRIGDKYGFVDRTGQLVIAAKYDKAEDFHNGLAKVTIIVKNPREPLRNKVRHAYIDKQGKVVWLSPPDQDEGTW